MARTNKVILVVGNRGTGKTDFLKDLTFKMMKVFSKCLIVDTFDSDTWHTLQTWNHPERLNISLPKLPLSKLKFWKNGLARLFGSNTDEMMSSIQENSKNSFIIFEDATRYIEGKLSADVKQFVLDSKQKNLDLVFVFHSLADVPPRLIRVADFLVLFKTSDGELSKTKYPWPQIHKMLEELRESANRYAYKIFQIN